MSKLGDLFVRLGLKKQDFDKGINDAQKELKGFEAASGRMASVAAAAWAAVAAAVVKFCKDAIKLTQKWGDEWNVTMAGIKGAYQSFVRQLSSGEGFSNLFANMREAARVARETAKALDEVFERSVSYSYQEADAKKYIEQQRMIMHDVSKSDAEREQAAQNIINKEKELGEVRWSIAKQKRDALSQEFEAQTGLNRAQQSYMLEQYNQNRDVIKQAREYQAELDKINKQEARNAQGGQAAHDYAKQQRDALNARYSDQVRNVAKLTKAYDKSNDELVKGLAEADVALINVETDTLRAQHRANSLLGRLTKEDSGGSGKTAIQTIVDDDITSLEKLEAALERADRKRKALMESREDVVPMTVDVFGIDEGMADIDAEMDEFFDVLHDNYVRLNDEKEKWQELCAEFGDAVAGGFSDACQELMNQLMGLDDFNPGAVIKALLTPLADMAIKAGEIIVAEGVAVEAAKTALTSFAGLGAIGAGALLIAAGTAAKAGLAALAKGGATTATTASSSGASGTGGNSTQNIETELTIYVEGRLSGSDIVLAGQKTLNSWSR